MARQTLKGKKSKQWAQRHINDVYVKQAAQSGFRARAAFKLQEIDQRYKLIKPNTQLIDLGAAPGSWCQYCVPKIGDKGVIIGIDLLAIKPINKVILIQGNFCDQSRQHEILAHLNNQAADLILSDMSPDLTGIRITDQANMENLLLNVIDSTEFLLKPGGNLVMKVFEGQMLAGIRKTLNSLFKKVISIKPEASRKQSKEFYLLAQAYQPK